LPVGSSASKPAAATRAPAQWRSLHFTTRQFARLVLHPMTEPNHFKHLEARARWRFGLPNSQRSPARSSPASARFRAPKVPAAGDRTETHAEISVPQDVAPGGRQIIDPVSFKADFTGSGRSSVANRCNSVVFPQPLGPLRLKRTALMHVPLTPLQHRNRQRPFAITLPHKCAARISLSLIE